MLNFSEINLPFGAGEVLSSAVGLFGVIGPFVLLALAFVFAPVIYNLIKIAVNIGEDNRLNSDKPRDQYTYREAAGQYMKEESPFRKRRW